MSRGGRAVAVIVILVVCAALGAYAAYVYIPPMLRGSGCEARNELGELRLTTEQTANAATIAAIARRMDLPRRATTIALATAFQESKLRNISYGDRDSLGLFQQRPSQGWGEPAQILDPVYATSTFYESLAEVDGYRDMPVHSAAQEVQRSADGRAYAQHVTKAKILSGALTGRAGAVLHCWYDGSSSGIDVRGLRTRAMRQLGPEVELQASGGGVNVAVSGQQEGWAFALWAVANAREYGIGSVAYRGSRWTAANGHDGWLAAEKTETGGSAQRVAIRGSD